MSKTQRWTFQDKTAIYYPDRRPGIVSADLPYAGGVLLEGSNITHALFDPEHYGLTVQEDLDRLQQLDRRYLSEYYFNNCLAIVSPEGKNLLALPIDPQCRPIPIPDITKHDDKWLTGLGDKPQADERWSDSDRPPYFITLPDFLHGMQLHPGVLREMKRYFADHRRDGRDDATKELRSDFGPTSERDGDRDR